MRNVRSVAAGEAQNAQQADEHVVERHVQANGGANVVGLAAVNDVAGFPQDRAGGEQDEQRADSQVQGRICRNRLAITATSSTTKPAIIMPDRNDMSLRVVSTYAEQQKKTAAVPPSASMIRSPAPAFRNELRIGPGRIP